MACNRCSGSRTPPPSPGGGRSQGYEVTFPDGSTATYLTPVEARKAIRQHGGGTAREVTS